jgi:RNA polymerase sigma factor (sigma-70 family)
MAPDRPFPAPEDLAHQARKVRRLARELVFDAGVAADVEQEALLAALERPPRSHGALGAWLQVTVRNLAHRAWRSRERRQARERASARPEGSVPDPAEILAREEERHLLVTELLALDEPWRSALVLRYLEELPPREVARRLAVPLDTARTRIHRGQELLRARLERRDRELGRAHGAWGLALVQGLRLSPDLGRVAWHLARPALSALPGGLSMTLAKVGGTAALVVALGLARHALQEPRDVIATDPSAPASSSAVVGELASTPVAAPGGERARVATASPDLSPAALRPEALTGPALGTLTLRTLWSDGTPAPGVAATITSYAGTGSWDAETPVRTDANGECSVQLPAGKSVAYWDRGDGELAVVTAGEETVLEHRLEAGMLVTGRVIDELDRPVAGAGIFLATNGPVAEGHVVGTSEAEGRFEIRDCVDGLGWLSARAAGHAPSHQVTLTGGAGARADVVLRVTPGGVLEGVVLDEVGQPVGGAWLQIGPTLNFERAPGEVGQVYLSAGQRVRSEDDGSFRVAGVAPGEWSVRARRPGFAPWSGSVEVQRGETRTLTVPLSVGCSLEGIVRDRDGNPVPDAEVDAGDDDFTEHRVLTDGEGHFAIRDLPVGEFVARVLTEEDGNCETTLVGSPGAELGWDPVLGGLDQAGRVVGLSAPEGCRVEASSWTPGAQSHVTARVDAGGLFVLRGLIEADYQVRVLAPGQGVFPLITLEGVRPSVDTLSIEVDPAHLPTVHLRGRVLDAQGLPAAGVPVAPSLAGFPNAPVRNTAADGTFSIGPVPPGRWRVTARPPGADPISTDWVDLGPDASWNFGDL